MEAQMNVAYKMIENKNLRDFLKYENIPVESLFTLFKECLGDSLLTFYGYNGLNELYINDNRIELTKDDLGNPKIIVKELREDNRKTYRIVRKGRKGFEAVLEV